MEKTKNLQLNKPDAEDFYNIDDFNQNSEIIDEAIEEQKKLHDDHIADEVSHITEAERKTWNSKAAGDHTHSYAGSDSVGGAATSAKECTGNSATATKATQDSDGNIIKSTYSKVGHTHSNYASKSIYDDTTVSMGRKNETTIGTRSFAFGNYITASGDYSHAEGYMTTASKSYSHAEGDNTTASGSSSHAEGCETTAGNYCSHAEGNNTTASGSTSHAEGCGTTALGYQHAGGHYNDTNTATTSTSSGTGKGSSFVIGNGTSSRKSNAFRIRDDGYIYATNSTVQTGADYAEYFEWADGNPDKKDRAGYFVTFDEENQEKIRYANDGDYILGIVSGMPSVIGNGDECWKQRYILDEFGRYIPETFEYEETVFDEETCEEKTITCSGIKWKENPEYDSSKPYLSRDQRPEWDAVGMLGVLSVYDDGTCQVNGYCKCTNGGIATATEERSGYRVIKRVTDNIVKVVLK